jgi:nuclear receptor subfamily 2 group E protein 1
MMLGATETLHQNAAQLLLMNIQWTKTVPAFVSLPHRDQLILLEESWRELFVLAASQFNLPLELGTKLLNNYDSDSDSTGKYT